MIYFNNLKNLIIFAIIKDYFNKYKASNEEVSRFIHNLSDDGWV